MKFLNSKAGFWMTVTGCALSLIGAIFVQNWGAASGWFVAVCAYVTIHFSDQRIAVLRQVIELQAETITTQSTYLKRIEQFLSR